MTMARDGQLLQGELALAEGVASAVHDRHPLCATPFIAIGDHVAEVPLPHAMSRAAAGLTARLP